MLNVIEIPVGFKQMNAIDSNLRLLGKGLWEAK